MTATGAATPSAARAATGICHQFLWRCRNRQYCESGTERRGASRNRVRAESGSGSVSDPALMQLPRGLRLLLHDQYATTCSGGVAPSARLGWRNWLGAQGTRRGVERRGIGNSPPAFQAWGGAKNASPKLQVESSLRGKRSDPSHGANAPPKAVADPVVKVPVRRQSL